ncbi:hypothetical protein Tco_0708529 [Tanacetum coccineum]
MLIWILGLKSVERASVLHQPDGVGSQRHHIVPYRELNCVLIALMARYKKMVLKQYALTVREAMWVYFDREAMWVYYEMHRSRIGLGIRSTTAAGLAGGSIATGIIIVAEVINDCMSSQRTDSSKDETDPPSTHGTRSPTSMLLTKGTTRMLCYGVLVNVWKSAAMLCLLCF